MTLLEQSIVGSPSGTMEEGTQPDGKRTASPVHDLDEPGVSGGCQV